MLLAALAATTLLLGLALAVARADAFGTYNTFGQNAEHERLTRVLQCGNPVPVPDCMQSRTMTVVAGGTGSLGAVGKPDDIRELYTYEYAHCDGGDYFDTSGYPQSLQKAHFALQECAFIVMQRLNAAVSAAGSLAGADGRLRPTEAAIGSCDFPAAVTSSSDSAKSAKCQVLNQFGRAMHAIEDFWSHSNWADRAEFGTISIQNPRGLLQTSIPAFLRYSTSAGATSAGQLQIPEGLISGCDDSSPAEVLARDCGKPGTVKDRVKHSDLNKDRGEIDPRTGRVSGPSTPRGKIGENFALAVTGARAHVAQTWADVLAAIRARYPGARGETIVRALASDTPWTRCAMSGESPNATNPPVGNQSSSRSVTVTVRNRSRNALGCSAASLRAGEWASLPPDEIGAGGSGSFRSQSDIRTGGPATAGEARFAIAGTDYRVEISWSNPAIGSNTYSCSFTVRGAPTNAPFSCDRSGGSGNDSSPVFTIANRSRGVELAAADPASPPRRGESAPPDDEEPSRPDELVLGEKAVDDCSGYAENFGLHVDGESCGEALDRVARSMARDDLCPDGWRQRRNVRIEGYNEAGDRGEDLPPLVMCSEKDAPGDEERERYTFQVLAH